MSFLKLSKLFSAKPSLGEFFRIHVFNHLRKPQDPNGEKNQPAHVLNEAKKSVGSLSRIFDSFKYPVASYDEMKRMVNIPNGLHQFMQKKINDVLPILLNENKTALSSGVIEAIGIAQYKELLEKSKSQDIALNVVKAVFISYGQRLIDNEADINKKMDISKSISPVLESLSNSVTIDGVIAPQAKISHRQINEFSDVLDAINKDGIKLPRESKIRDRFNEAREWLNDENMPLDAKMAKASSRYDAAITECIKSMDEFCNMKPPAPKEVHWFIRVVRLIFGDENPHDQGDLNKLKAESELKMNAMNLLNRLEGMKQVVLKSPELDAPSGGICP